MGSLAGTAGTILSNVSGISPTLTVSMSTGSAAYGGILANGSGTLGLTISGSGTLTLLGSNTYTGNTMINGGTLMIGNGGATGSLSTGTVITDNGALAFNLSGNAAQGSQFTASAITGTGGLLQMGPGVLTLTRATPTPATQRYRRHPGDRNGGNSGSQGTGSISDTARWSSAVAIAA